MLPRSSTGAARELDTQGGTAAPEEPSLRIIKGGAEAAEEHVPKHLKLLSLQSIREVLGEGEIVNREVAGEPTPLLELGGGIKIGELLSPTDVIVSAKPDEISELVGRVNEIRLQLSEALDVAVEDLQRRSESAPNAQPGGAREAYTAEVLSWTDVERVIGPELLTHLKTMRTNQDASVFIGGWEKGLLHIGVADLVAGEVKLRKNGDMILTVPYLAKTRIEQDEEEGMQEVVIESARRDQELAAKKIAQILGIDTTSLEVGKWSQIDEKGKPPRSTLIFKVK